MKKILLSLILAGAVFGTPQAHADMFALWLKPKVDFIGGTGEVFKRFEGSPAGGIEAGLTFFGISLWGDFEYMGDSQSLGSVNLGYDLSFGKKLKFTAGAYGGVIFFNFPPAEKGSPISAAQRDELTALLNPVGLSYDEFEMDYQEQINSLNPISDMAVGVNGRLRLSLEYKIMKFFSVGMQGSYGYHFIVSGDDFSDSATSLAIDGALATQSFNDAAKEEVSKKLKEALGAEVSNLDDLAGSNYSVGAFVNFSF